MQNNKSESLHKLSLVGFVLALGIIYGDIGTSPLYVMKAIVNAAIVVDNNFIIGAVSCIIWTLTLQTTVKYVLITLRADNKGEGGIFSLFALMRKRRKNLFIVAIIGGSALLADSIITPSITVVSAVEGLQMIKPSIHVILISLSIITFLFFIQQFGTAFIGKSFGPIMFIWFSTIGVLGIVNLMAMPEMFKAFNPWYAINLLISYPKGFLLLGAVFLCTTGAEALYADLGHCGLKNIRASWVFVKTMLIFNYLGQGAWVLVHTNQIKTGLNPFFSMMPAWFLPFGILLSTMAAVIASQALISGSYTLISEAISLNFWPRTKIKYPSFAKGQMYVPSVNWLLFFAVALVIIMFRNSSNMEAAYGLSITITMMMTTLLMFSYMRLRHIPLPVIIVFVLTYLTIETTFLVANLHKFIHGGWFTLAVATILSLIMLIMFKGRRIKNRFISYDKIKQYLPVLCELSEDKTVPLYSSQLVYTTHADRAEELEAKTIWSLIYRKPKRADAYWFLHVDTVDNPYTAEYKITELAPGKVFRVDFYLGFKIPIRLNDYFKQILETVKADGTIDLMSSHPSLRAHNIPADFRFVQLERVLPRYIDLPFWDKLTLTTYSFFHKHGVNDVTSYGLDTTLVTVEKVPLTIPSDSGTVKLRLRRT
jgi:KUP system potassium uptake protein